MTSEISNAMKLSPVTVVKPVIMDDSVADVVRSVDSVKSAQSSVESDALNKDNHKPALSLVKQAADHGNQLMQTVNRNLQFKVDDATKEVVVKIVDSESGEVVRQIPTEEMLEFVKHLQQMQGKTGVVLNDRA